MPNWIALLSACSLLWAASKIVYAFFLSPLRKIPGPRLAAVTDLWFLHKTVLSKGSISIHAAFQKYGDIVRIGPKSVAVRGAEDLHKIYRGHKYLKDERLKRAQFFDIVNITSAVTPGVHTRLRKMTNPLFASDSLKNLRGPLNEMVDDLHAVIQKSIKHGEALDMWRNYRLFTFDLIGHAAFGKPFGVLKTGKDNLFLSNLDKVVSLMAVRIFCPETLLKILERIPIPAWQDIIGAEDRLFAFGRELVSSHKGADASRYDMIGQLSASVDPETGEALSERAIVSTVLVYLLGGTDTTATALSWSTYALARHPHVQTRLRAELQAAITDADALPEFSQLRRLTYLSAVIKEALRRWAPTAVLLPRRVPTGGAVHQGHFIPEDTMIGCTAFSMHRNEEFFPNAEEFIPERWTEEVEGVLRLKERPDFLQSYMPWSTGVRSCQGQPVAELEVYTVLASIVMRYEIALDASTTDESMADTDLLVLTPKAHKVALRFKQL